MTASARFVRFHSTTRHRYTPIPADEQRARNRATYNLRHLRHLRITSLDAYLAHIAHSRLVYNERLCYNERTNG